MSNTDPRIQKINETEAEYPRDASIHSLFEANALNTPQQVAVECGDQQLSYAELEARSNQLAQYLCKRGVRKGDLIGVCIERSVDVPITLLGILKAGAGYVPLDPEYPDDRLRYMCEDAGVSMIIAHESLVRLVSTFGINTVFLDIDEDKIVAQPIVSPSKKIHPGSDIAYVIYTSGSTGKPKGVCVPHRAAVNLLTSFANSPGFTAKDCYLALTTLSFDISVAEIFVPLVTGGRMAIVDRETAKDGQLLCEAIQKHDVTVMQATPPTWRFVLESGWEGKSDLRSISTGEAMPRDLVKPLIERTREVWNLYGPTETTVWSARWQVTDPETSRILIGEPFENTTLRIVDASLEPVPYGEEGELLIGGDGVTLGYLNREELTEERFITVGDQRFYRTGDLAKYTDSGLVQCLGRIDTQVKLHGYRIELEEIDFILSEHPGVLRAAAVVREDTPGDLRLVGYVIPANDSIDTEALIKFASERLPDYMVPTRLTVVESFPQTPSGKLDRKSFPEPSNERPDVGIEFVTPRGEIEIAIAKIWASVLNLDRVGIDDNFFQFGGTSILAQRVIAKMREECGVQMTAPELFAHATIERVIQFCGDEICLKPVPTTRRVAAATEAVAVDAIAAVDTIAASAPVELAKQETSADAVATESAGVHKEATASAMNSEDGYAIVGLAARLPGAPDVHAYWKNLIDNVESITFFEPDQLDESLSSEVTSDPHYVPARGIIDGADEFDASFFAVPPREAALIDPQQRVMLEVAHQALEDAGCVSDRFHGRVGVWAGTYCTDYMNQNLLPNEEIVDATGRFQLGVYNEKDYIATRVAHKLNLTGPAINVNTACSSSLVAVIEACKSLAAGHCDAALAGAASVSFPQASGHLHQTGSILSPDGHCRPFDASAAGTLFSDGAGMVVLKRLADANRDGDRIYAVVRGVGINNDGGEKASFTAPSIEGQVGAIQMALEDAGIDAETIGYVEAHGTATPVGDPIEVAALSRVHSGTGRKEPCGIGSVKSNIGHCVAAAGIAGLIKNALSLHNEVIPATLHYTSPNPQIDFAASGFEVVDKNKPWPRTDAPRRAAVSSFGVGGTNAHIILEEAGIPIDSGDNASDSQLPQLMTLSAKCEESLEALTRDLASLETSAASSDIAFTLQTARTHHAYRKCVIQNHAGEYSKPPVSGKAPRRPSELVWMFPGQGSQYVGMGQDLYEHNEVFHQTLSECSEILKPLIGEDLRDILFGSADTASEREERLRQTSITQPAMFAISYSLAQTYLNLGLRPVEMMGHSIGEFVAATVAGVCSLEDGCKLISERGRLMQELPPGAMLSVREASDVVLPRLDGDLCIASYNAPKLCVVAGPIDQVEALSRRLESDGIACRMLHTSHAFHSSMMDPIVGQFEQVVRSVKLNRPQMPIRSTVTGDRLTDAEATDPNYWAEHLRKPVRYQDAVLNVLQDDPQRTLLEIGPRKTLATLARQIKAQHPSLQKAGSDEAYPSVIASLSDNSVDNAEWIAWLEAIAGLWAGGNKIRWESLHNDVRQIVSLPVYPFNRKRHFIEPIKNPHSAGSTSTSQEKPRVSLSDPSPVIITTEQSIVTQTRKEQITVAVKELFESTSGFDLNEFSDDTSFFEMGMDSLILTQTAAALKREFSVDVSFRQLLEEFTCVEMLVGCLDAELPADRYADVVETVVSEQAVQESTTPDCETVHRSQTVHQSQTENVSANLELAAAQIGSVDASARSIMNQQLEVMRVQLAILGGGASTGAVPAPAPAAVKTPTSQPTKPSKVQAASVPETPKKKTFGAGARVSLDASSLTSHQQNALDAFIAKYNAKTRSSKEYAQTHREYLADPRTVSGFRPDLKEMTYPLVANRSKGSKLWDIDGNEYVDFTCGFGSNFLGHSPNFVVEAVTRQVGEGYEIGPQHPLAGEVAKLFCEMTGAQRMAFCNTGSEAVLGACRLARTATARDEIVMFTNDYHGILDEVVVRGARGKSFPAASGIPRSMVDNVTVLEYGADESLEYIKQNLANIAAVVVEPVQSRHPEFQPGSFLKALGELLSGEETALIFDEVICGLRIAPGGAQEYFGVQADIGTYGKIVGGGMPIGVIAGKAKYLDGLDGGFWTFGNDSKPEAGMTYFAGTFVRHPLALAAAHATLTYLKAQGRGIYDRINGLSNQLAQRLNTMFDDRGVPMFMANFGSLFKTQFHEEQPFSEVFFAMLRERGVHVWDHRPCPITLAHSQEDIDFIVDAFTKTVDAMLHAELLVGVTPPEKSVSGMSTTDEMPALAEEPQPIEDARPGKDRFGNPGMFVEDSANPGEYIQVR